MGRDFSFNDVVDFDSHISNSIPSYDGLTSLVQRIAADYAQDNTSVVDLGCSTGKLLKEMHKKDTVQYIGVDNSFNPAHSDVEFFHADLLDYEIPKSSVVISLFTLQFLPLRKRKNIIKQVSKKLVDGGVFICAEKVHTVGRHLEVSLQNELLNQKRRHFTDEEILDKSIGLSSVMRCRTANELRRELASVGDVDSVWQWGQFICHVVTKEK